MYRKLILAFDAGSSLIKSIYGWIDERGNYVIKYMVMGSEYLVIDGSSSKYMANPFGMGNPEDNAWIRTEKDGEIAVLGRMARESKGCRD